jgi:hypothetical protein
MEGDTMSRRRRIALLIVAGAHLGLVTVGALKVRLPDGRASLAIAEYGALSGAENFYTFFAPGVDTELRPIFEVKQKSGSVITDVLTKPESSEVDLRVGNLISIYWWEDEALRRALVASWAGAMFTRHAGAQRVDVRVEVCDIPSMVEYREGERPAWNLLDRITFSRGVAGNVAQDPRR